MITRLLAGTHTAVVDADAVLTLVNDPGFIAGINDRGVRTREQARDHLREWAQAHQEK
ncbi:GNAT family N-acetyltransferase, partial [Xanthomonas arboricola]